MSELYSCPSRDELQRMVLGQLPELTVRRIQRHLEECPKCMSALEECVASDELLEAAHSSRGAGYEPTKTIYLPVEWIRGAVSTWVRSHDTTQFDKNGLPVSTLDIHRLLSPPESADEMGRVGDFRVLRVLGSGGMAVVFEAEDSRSKRRVALKLMHPAIAAEPGGAGRFLRDAQSAAPLVHPHAVTIYQVGIHGQTPFVAMELLQGETLEDRLNRTGRLSIREALRIAIETATGLAAAHARGLVHRNIKPTNIWLEGPDISRPRAIGDDALRDSDTAGSAVERHDPTIRERSGGNVKILDFGCATAFPDDSGTNPGLLIGTPAYMAPEQLAGHPVDPRADLFSLGCVLYRMVAGKQPFGGDNLLSVVRTLALNEPEPIQAVNPQVPQALSELIDKLLAKSAEDRPATARVVVEQLRAIEQQLPPQRGMDQRAAGESAPCSPPVQPITQTVAPVSPPVGPARSARQFDPEARRFDNELAGLMHRRLLAGTAIGAVAFAMMILVALSSRHGRTDYLSLTLYASMTIWYTALVTWLVRDRDMSLSRLRIVEILALAAYAAHCARKDFEHYSLYWGTLQPNDQWLIVSHSLLNWVFLIFIYGVLIPNDWRRSLRVLAPMAVIPLGVYAATWLSFPESRRPTAPLFELFAMARVMAAAVAIAAFGAHKLTTARQEASEARHLGNYRIKRRLSTGGMGEVYLAEHRLLNRPYAIKLIRPEIAANPTSRRRFEREIQAMARLTHWNTIEIIDYGHAPDGTFYYVMEYVEGLNLGELVDRHGPLDPGRAVYLLRQACAALAEAHAMGLIHRDIKPGNMMLTQQAGLADALKVLDFGLVQDLAPPNGDDKLTQPGLLMGTPGYMSPEQATGTADMRSDIYSLGAVGYFLLSGQPPFAGHGMRQILTSLVQEPTPLRELRPEVPADLQAVIQRCLRRDPDGRFSDIHLVDNALADCACAASWNSEEAAAWWRTSSV